MNRILAIIMLTALPAMGQTYCMVTGHLSRALSTAYTNMTLTFTPQSTPLIDNPLLVSGASVTTTSTAPVGYFSLNLEHGIYKVQIGALPRDVFTITIPPAVNETNHISTYITSGATTNFVPGSVSGWTQTASDSRYVKLTNGVAVKPVLSNNTATIGWVWTATNAAGAGHWAVQTGGSGESTTVSNLSVTNATTFPITVGLSGTDIPFKTFRAGANMVITNEGTNLIFASTASGGGTPAGDEGMAQANVSSSFGGISNIIYRVATGEIQFTNNIGAGLVRFAAPATFHGVITNNGIVYLGNNMLPLSDNTYDLGSAGFAWNDIVTANQIATNMLVYKELYADHLTGGRAAVINSSKQITNSAAVSMTELEYLDGVTSAIQTQLNNLGLNATSFVYSIGANTTNYASARQGGDAVLTNLVGTVANNVTNVVSLSTTNATSKPLTNSYTAGVLTLRGIEAGANVTITANGSNYVIASSASDFNLTQFDTNGNVSIKSGAVLTNIDHYGTLDLLDTPGTVPGGIALYETNGVKASYWQSHWTNHWNLTNRLSTATNSQAGWALTVHGIDAAGTLTTWTNTAVTNWVKVTGSSDITVTGSGSAGVQTFDVTAASTLTRNADWDTAGEVETAWGSVNILLETEIDASSELRALMDDESGTGALIFADGAIGAATATTPAANDNDTSVATTAFVQTELADYQLIDTELTEWSGVSTNKNLFTNSLIVIAGSGGITVTNSIVNGLVTFGISDDDAGGGSLTSNNLSRVSFTNWNSIGTNYVIEDNYQWRFYDGFNRPNTTNGYVSSPANGHTIILNAPSLGTSSTNIGRIQDGTVMVDAVPGNTNGNIYVKTTLNRPATASGMRYRQQTGNGGSGLAGATLAITSDPGWNSRMLHLNLDRDGMNLAITTNGVGNFVYIGQCNWNAIANGTEGVMELEWLGNNMIRMTGNGTNTVVRHAWVDYIFSESTNVFFQIGGATTNLVTTMDMMAVWAGDSRHRDSVLNTNQFGWSTNSPSDRTMPMASIISGASLTNTILYTATNSGQFLVGGTIYGNGGIQTVNSLVSGIATNGGLRVTGLSTFEANIIVDNSTVTLQDNSSLVMDGTSIIHALAAVNVGGILTVTNSATVRSNLALGSVIGTAYDSSLRLDGTNVGAYFMLSVPNNTLRSNKFLMDIGSPAAGDELVVHGVSGNVSTITNAPKRYRTIYFNSSAMVSNLTTVEGISGAVFGTTEYGSSTNRIADHYVFSDGVTNAVQWKSMMPLEWDQGTVKAKFFWSSTNALAGLITNVWAIDGASMSNGEHMWTNGWGTAQIIRAKGTNANSVAISEATPALTISGTPTAGDMVYFRAKRLGGHTDDQMTNGFARLLGVAIQYQESATRPAAW